ncbi:hypothetical protein [Nocardia thailandica]|uniref:Secreted protein n=1 Tax=Nocardia thailandica TaxID=257275 RepID=A0ABW6PVH8_9NOCA|nr:hypothetical protein [Nocardia thailandica]
MRNSLGLAATTLAATALVAAAPGAAAQPGAAPVADTGSSAVDSATRAAGSLVELVQRGDVIGVIVLLGITPIQMVTGGICDLVTGAGSSNPCSPTRY